MFMTIKVRLEAFSIPNYVEEELPLSRQADEPRTYNLNEIDSETLAALCEEFTVSVFKRAGKTRPEKEAPSFNYGDIGPPRVPMPKDISDDASIEEQLR